MPDIPFNDFKAQWEVVRADVLDAVEAVGRSGWYVLGREVEAFEGELAACFGLDFAAGCASGLDAIELGLRAAGLAPGDRVLTTPLSAFATSLAVVRAGAVPVFVDVDESGQLDLDRAESALEADPGLRFLVPVHLYGHALPLARLRALRDRFELRVVEDCAQAIGARSGGEPVGSVGVAAATSFYPTKNLGALGDGGAVLTNSPACLELVRELRDYGQSAKYEHTSLGLNSRLDELHAAILRRAFLPRLEAATARRRAIAERYRQEIDHPALAVPPPPEASDSVWHLFPVLVDGDREAFRAHLGSAGVGTAVHYPKLIPEQTALKSCAGSAIVGGVERATRFARQVVSLPIHPYLEDDAIAAVVAACNGWRP